MENRMKQRLSRMFRSSFGSCRTRNLADVIENKTVLVPQNKTHHYFRVFEPPPPPPPAPKHRHFPSISKPETGPRQKVSDRYYYSPLGFADKCGSTCPPVSPISPFMYYHTKQRKNNKKNERSGSKHKSKNKKKLVKSTNREALLLSSSSRDNGAYYSWFSSDDEEDEITDRHTLFSSRSTTLSSDSSGSLHRKRRSSRRRRRVGSEIGGNSNTNSNVLELMEEGRMKDSVAVVKKSSDPYNDFRMSMVEMIVEKQIFGGKELENLLQVFLSLNMDCHHRIIVEVFTEILETLFSDIV